MGQMFFDTDELKRATGPETYEVGCVLCKLGQMKSG